LLESIAILLKKHHDSMDQKLSVQHQALQLGVEIQEQCREQVRAQLLQQHAERQQFQELIKQYKQQPRTARSLQRPQVYFRLFV
jgi:hypothetical protein